MGNFSYRVDNDRNEGFSYVAQFGDLNNTDSPNITRHTCASIVSLDVNETTCLLYAIYDVSKANQHISITHFEGIDETKRSTLNFSDNCVIANRFYEFFVDTILVDRHVVDFLPNNNTQSTCLVDVPFDVIYTPNAPGYLAKTSKKVDFDSNHMDIVMSWFAPDAGLRESWLWWL